MTKFKIIKGEKRQVVIDSSGEYVIELVGRGASVEVLGVIVVDGNENETVDVKIIHKAKNTNSDTLIRVVVKDRAKVVINGMVEVKKNAQKAKSMLKENVLLLSDKAKVEAVPNMEIEADDVRCSHAATVGKIDEEQMFYLMSRGIVRKAAEQMIVGGFLDLVRKRIK